MKAGALMKVKTATSVIVALLVLAVAIAQPVQAQSVSTRTDRPSYVPGDSGTLIVTIVNENPTDTLEIRNITVYFPWAQLVDGKWPSGANATVPYSPWKLLGSSASGNNVLTEQISFSIPSWYGGGGGSDCPGSNGPRYGLYTDCIIVGTTGNPPRYTVERDTNIVMALPTYTPPSLVSLAIPIATLIVLVIATAFLAMTWSGIRRLEAKK